MMRPSLTSAALLLCGACAASTDVPVGQVYTGTYSAQVVETTVSTSLTGGGTFNCTNTYTMSGTLSMTLDNTGGLLNGTAQVNGAQTETAHSGPSSCIAKGNLDTKWEATLTGSISDMHFSAERVATNGGYNVTTKTSFSGVLFDGKVTGSLGFSASGSGTIGQTAITQSYSVLTSITLR